MTVTIADLRVNISANTHGLGRKASKDADLFANEDYTITRDSLAGRQAEVFEGGTKLLSVMALMVWPDKPGCILKELPPKPRLPPVVETYRTSYDVRIVFDLSKYGPDEADAIRRHYAWCGLADFVMPPAP